MIKPVITEWTIVILGRWNTAIFNPKWLGENIFEEKKLNIEVAMDAGFPMQITGDKVLLIPREDRLILAPTEISDVCLQKVEDISVKLLQLLSHTPVARIGLNFGYETELDDDFINLHFPDPDAAGCLTKGLITRKRFCNRSCDYEGEALNMNFTIDDKLRIKFNYDSETTDTKSAIDKIKNKFLQHKKLTLKLLNELYNLKEVE